MVKPLSLYALYCLLFFLALGSGFFRFVSCYGHENWAQYCVQLNFTEIIPCQDHKKAVTWVVMTNIALSNTFCNTEAQLKLQKITLTLTVATLYKS